MHRVLQIVTLMVMVTWIPRCSLATERGFEFSGSVDFVFQGSPPSNPFGLSIDENTLVSGRFVYETTSPATHDLPGDTTGYRQLHTNGFWAEFDGVRVQADDYTIEIANDVDNNGTLNDVVSIRFSSDLGPPAELPLLVNGSPQSVGQFSIAFFASSALYSDTSLPSDLDPAMFVLPMFANILSDQALPASRLALFTLDSFASISLFGSDHDLDDDVDGRDFLIWQRNFGQSGQNGDANSDYEIDQLDLALWQAQYGSIGPAMQTIAVPEPPFGVLLSGLLLLVWGFVMPRKRHLLAPFSQPT